MKKRERIIAKILQINDKLFVEGEFNFDYKQEDDDSEFDVVFSDSRRIEKEEFQRVFQMTKANMEIMYNQAPGGWNDKEKRKEMLHAESKFMFLVDSKSKEIIAFVNYRYEVDDDELHNDDDDDDDDDDGDEDECLCEAVLYLYEIQVIGEKNRKGLGNKMMKIIEELALLHKVDSILLTVFRHNIAAQQFYRKLGYTPHYSSPCNFTIEEFPDQSYNILTKKIQ